jgi:hypothetical protein
MIFVGRWLPRTTEGVCVGALEGPCVGGWKGATVGLGLGTYHNHNGIRARTDSVPAMTVVIMTVTGVRRFRHTGRRSSIMMVTTKVSPGFDLSTTLLS